MHPDRTLDTYAARQYGTFSRQQATSAGMTPRMIQRRLESGKWIRLASGVYAVASAPPKWERQMAAAVLTREGSIVAGASAAYLHAMDGFSPGRPVIMVGSDGNARSSLARVIRSRRFAAVERVRKRGFVVTDEAETIMTLAAVLSSERLEAVVDFVLARRSCRLDDICRIVGCNEGARGVAGLRRIAEHRTPSAYQPPTSELERHLYPLLDDRRIPAHTRQMPISYRTLRATVDAYIPAWRLIVEADGRRWHTRQADLDRDRLRDNEATAHGLAVLRFTWTMLTTEPGRCLETLIRTGQVRSVS